MMFGSPRVPIPGLMFPVLPGKLRLGGEEEVILDSKVGGKVFLFVDITKRLKLPTA